MNRLFLFGIVFTALFTITACSDNRAEKQPKNVELTISAAASLHDALTEIKEDFETQHKNITLFYNIGGSGSLKQQILQGAPADLFLSAAPDQFNELIEGGHIIQNETIDLLSNQLVLITNKETPVILEGFTDLSLKNVNKVAIGIPDTVPAGKYAYQTLSNLGVWDNISPKLVQAKDVRQVLTYVETGNVDAGIVYMTDAISSNKVKVVSVADKQFHDQIVYPAGIVNNTQNRKEAKVFLDYLQSKSAKQIFKKYGFSVLE